MHFTRQCLPALGPPSTLPATSPVRKMESQYKQARDRYAEPAREEERVCIGGAIGVANV